MFGQGVLAMVCLAVMLTACQSVRPIEEQNARPSGEEVLNRSVEAMGGEKAFERITNRVVTGTMEMAETGVKGSMKTYQRRPNKTYVEVEIPNLMKVRQGFVNDVAWEANSMTGPRILEGPERDLMAFSARFDDSELDDVFSSIECTGEEYVNGEVCHVVVMKAEGLSPITMYISKETYLNVITHMAISTPMGKMDVEILTSDYREVDGLLYPHRNVQSVMGQKMVMVLEKIEHNAELEEGQFDLPEEVKALLSAEATGK